MAFTLTKAWDEAVAKHGRDLYDTLSEKAQRRFAAVQARPLGYGGVQYLAKLLGCSRRTSERGLAELDVLPHDPAAVQVRRPGAGRKKKRLPHAPAAQNLQAVLETRTAGVPDAATRVCTDRSPAMLAIPMAKRGTPGCAEVRRHGMDAHDLRRRQMAQDLAGGHAPDRKTPLERLAVLSAA